jgi:hypothetical protein
MHDSRNDAANEEDHVLDDMVMATGYWDEIECAQFEAGVMTHGWGNWCAIARDFVPSRSGLQVKNYAYNFATDKKQRLIEEHTVSGRRRLIEMHAARNKKSLVKTQATDDRMPELPTPNGVRIQDMIDNVDHNLAVSIQDMTETLPHPPVLNIDNGNKNMTEHVDCLVVPV